MTRTTLVATLALLALAGACGRSEINSSDVVADRVFVNGAIYTVTEAQPWAEAVAVAGGRIIYVGDNEPANAFVGDDTDVVDLDGQMMLPGFHDSHIHLLIGVMADEECSLLRIETADEVAAKLDACTQLAGIGD
ncbi:MAG: hypothetical protein R3288_16230, partial [Woeseiaceae bacterium]|nr:hypothetical protein [Woeseiaceae bacterium]